jgi:hypothetical protein
MRLAALARIAASRGGRGVERTHRHNVQPKRSVARREQQCGDRFAIAVGEEPLEHRGRFTRLGTGRGVIAS